MDGIDAHLFFVLVFFCPCSSASRVGESDGKINRKRIKAIRVELQKKGWKSIGY
jgi:hypothetical protein